MGKMFEPGRRLRTVEKRKFLILGFFKKSWAWTQKIPILKTSPSQYILIQFFHFLITQRHMKGDDSLGPKLKQKILFCLVYRFWTNEWIWCSRCLKNHIDILGVTTGYWHLDCFKLLKEVKIFKFEHIIGQGIPQNVTL